MQTTKVTIQLRYYPLKYLKKPYIKLTNAKTCQSALSAKREVARLLVMLDHDKGLSEARDNIPGKLVISLESRSDDTLMITEIEIPDEPLLPLGSISYAASEQIDHIFSTAE